MQEALILADRGLGQSSKVGVYVGCMWAHEFVEVLPHLVRTPPFFQCKFFPPCLYGSCSNQRVPRLLNLKPLFMLKLHD